jgi:hypothetical protein
MFREEGGARDQLARQIGDFPEHKFGVRNRSHTNDEIISLFDERDPAIGKRHLYCDVGISGLEADQSGGKNRGRPVWGKRQANCARQCDAVILNLGNSLLSQHQGGPASLEELLPLASGSPFELSEDMSRRRMQDAGVVLTATNTMIAELAQNWGTQQGQQLIQLLFTEVLPPIQS